MQAAAFILVIIHGSFPVSWAGGGPSSPSSPPVSSRAPTEGPSDRMLDAAYYNFYQPTRYPKYYNNLYNYQQYQVTVAQPPKPSLVYINHNNNNTNGKYLKNDSLFRSSCWCWSCLLAHLDW